MMARFTRVLTSKEFVELKPYIKYLHQDTEFDAEEFAETFKMLVQRRFIFRTPTVRVLAERFLADKQVSTLPKCLTV
jgi:hypothetical protein